MTPILQDDILGSDLDCNGFVLRNIGAMTPTPSPLVSIDDPRLSDPRAILDGSVTNDSVNPIAGIDQSKLNLGGNIPPSWIGTQSNQAAQGDLVERVANKGVPGGYAGLDANGLILSSNVTPGPQPGTVNSVGLIMPKEFTVTNSPVQDSGDLTVQWANADAVSWFGRIEPTEITDGVPDLTPHFVTKAIPVSLIPALDASQFTTVQFSLNVLPFAIGLGAEHAIGILPDPELNGDPNDYLGRDMKWRAFDNNIAYQPDTPPVQISVNYLDASGQLSVSIRSVLKGSSLFYRVNGGTFIEVIPTGSDVVTTIMVNPSDFVEAFAAKSGYNNSVITSLVVQTPSSFF